MLLLVSATCHGFRCCEGDWLTTNAGNTQGNVILFEPTTSEHLSARTIDQIPVTAISPAADCRTFAIGYVPIHLARL